MMRTGIRSVLLDKWHWGVACGAILMAWVGLWLLAAAMQHASPIVADLDMLIGILLASYGHQAGFSTLLGMWTAMAVAMMLPGHIPVLRTYESLREAGLANRAGFMAITGGDLAVWAVCSVAMTLVNTALIARPVARVVDLAASRCVTCLLLAGAGLYQLSSFRDRCLVHCRHPLIRFLARGLGPARRDFATGAGFGLWCLGCGWLLMGLGLIAGLMSMAWMGLAAVIITLEKLPEIGRHVTCPLGLVLIVTSIGIRGQDPHPGGGQGHCGPGGTNQRSGSRQGCRRCQHQLLDGE